MIIAISGSHGFIGKKLVTYFTQGNKNKLVLLDKINGYDLTNEYNIKTVQKFDVFVHLAGKSYVPDSYSNPEAFFKVNFLTTLNALNLCRRNKAKMIFISSYVYGDPEYLPIDEYHPLKGFNPYAQSKIIGEKLCESYFHDFNVPCTILRPFNIYGQGQHKNFLLPSILSQIKSGADIIKLKDSKPRRDFVHVDDFIKAIELCVFDTQVDIKYFNIASGTSYSVMEISQIIQNFMGKYLKIRFNFSNNEDRINEVNETRGCNLKIKEELGWSPKIPFAKGLEKWFINELNLAK